MTNDELHQELTALDEVVRTLAGDLRPSLRGIRHAVASIRTLSELSLEITHEVVRRLLTLEETR